MSKPFPLCDKYLVYDDGRVYTLYWKRFMKQQLKNGYNSLGLRINGKRKTYLIHRIVAITYIPNPNNLPVVNHKNGDRLDNKVENLEWSTQKHNAQHAIRTGLKDCTKQPQNTRIVLQYDKEGNLLKEWNSAAEIRRFYGIHNSSICAVCNGKKKTAGGFHWEYKPNHINLKNYKLIPGLEHYLINDQGKVYSLRYGKNLRPSKGNNGYECVTLRNKLDGKRKRWFVHVLVMLAFVGESPSEKYIVNHINSIKNDNRFVNLEYCTFSENNLHSFKRGGMKKYLKPVSMMRNSEITNFNSIAEASEYAGLSRYRIGRMCLSEVPFDGCAWKYEINPHLNLKLEDLRIDDTP